MSTTSIAGNPGLSRLKLFFALSRTPHAVLDMATPALGAVLALGAIPGPGVVFLGLLAAFAGYTAVYALNDVVDYRVDKEKIRACGLPCSAHDLDAVFVRHPLAQGLLSLREGIVWTVGWGAVALVCAYLLNPVCALVFILGCVAEAVYCLLFQVSYLRTLVSGAVKTAGGIAAVYAVDPNPSLLFLLVLFLWLFTWEIGGQNIPNDWSDREEDKNLQADTIAVRFGPGESAAIIMASLLIAVALSLLLFGVSAARLGSVYLPAALAAGFIYLIVPAYRLYISKAPGHASALFNRASYYPIVMFLVVLISLVF